MSILGLLQSDHRSFDDPITISYRVRTSDIAFDDPITVNYCQKGPVRRDTVPPELMTRSAVINIWKSDMGESPPTPAKGDKIAIESVDYRVTFVEIMDEGERYRLTLLREV